MINSISASELKLLLNNNEVLLIDVRDKIEHLEEHIKESILIPLADFEVEKIPPHGDKKLVFYCRSGVRSAIACAKVLEELPNLMVYNLNGGILAWKNFFSQ